MRRSRWRYAHPRASRDRVRSMRFVLNVIWLVFEGLWMAIAYLLAAVVCFVLIITIPFGLAALRISRYALWPFGRKVVRRDDAGVASGIGNVLWIVLFGWWLAIGHLVAGVLMCLTIIGIPLGLASFKLIPVSLLPLGREIVPSDDPPGVDLDTGQAHDDQEHPEDRDADEHPAQPWRVHPAIPALGVTAARRDPTADLRQLPARPHRVGDAPHAGRQLDQVHAHRASLTARPAAPAGSAAG